MMKRKIISVSGFMGSGKDSMATYLIENRGFVKLSFARALKDMVATLFCWDRELLEGVTEESRDWREQVDRWWTDELDLGIDVTPRWVLQNMGTEVMRKNFHHDIWVLNIRRWLQMHPDTDVVFTDTRFLNEFQALREEGATILGIHRKTPKWIEDFYIKVDGYAYDIYGHRFIQMDMTKVGQRIALSEYASKANSQGPKLHQSEYEHLVWPNYDGILDNTKTLTDTFQQLRTFLK